jgi:hypothetical protein
VGVVEKGKYVTSLQNHTLCLCLAHRLVAVPTVCTTCNTKHGVFNVNSYFNTA